MDVLRAGIASPAMLTRCAVFVAEVDLDPGEALAAEVLGVDRRLATFPGLADLDQGRGQDLLDEAADRGPLGPQGAEDLAEGWSGGPGYAMASARFPASLGSTGRAVAARGSSSIRVPSWMVVVASA